MHACTKLSVCAHNPYSSFYTMEYSSFTFGKQTLRTAVHSFTDGKGSGRIEGDPLSALPGM